MKRLFYGFIMLFLMLFLASCSGGACNNISVNLNGANGGVYNNETNVSLQPLFILQFSVPMNPEYMNSDTIILTPALVTGKSSLSSNTQSGANVPLGKITASNGNTVFSFTTAQPLAPNQKYYLYVKNAVSAAGPTVSTMFSFTTGQVNFVIVGTNSTVLYSTNGIQWAVESLGISKYFNSVTFADNKFVAAGESGVVYTSTNGVSWEPQVSGTSDELFDTVYGNNLFVTVGCNGTVIKSPNAIDWAVESVGADCDLYSVAYGQNTFVTTGINGSIFSSSDAVTWTEQASPTSYELTAVTYGNGKFVAVGDNGVIATATAVDSWGLANSSGTTTNQLADVIYANNKYVALGRTGGVILNSSDADNWSSVTVNNSNLMYGLTYGTNKFFAVGEKGTILTSPDAVSWSFEPVVTTESLYSIAYRN